ncbi:MAG: hydrogenase formation protein HypD [Elusimicrobia bacterium]|nr:hydrogenase formation protein HypD [Elusimicrobiota bacterium]
MKVKNKFSSPLWNDSLLASNAFKEIKKLVSQIYSETGETIKFMEVCGTHTMAIAASGMRKFFPPELKMLSGPGCPVCVTSQGDIDRILEIAAIEDVIITTFGDMMRVKGSLGRDLHSMREAGADIRVLYSPLDALRIASENKNKKIVFIGVGFETTAPIIAQTVFHAHDKKINNFFITPLFKLVPPALKAVLSNDRHKISGFILPGHVSVIIGAKSYDFVARKHKVPCVVAGFEPMDIISGINMLLLQIQNGASKVETEYFRAVKMEGNKSAQAIMKKVFKIASAQWRAIGSIEKSGLILSDAFKRFDAFKYFKIRHYSSKEPKGCICGKIIMGQALPEDCRFFGKKCTPSDAIGPCMVSSEGACAAWFKYGG